MIKEREVCLELQAKTINRRYCSAECPFIVNFKAEDGEICYACSLFGGLENEFEAIDIPMEGNTSDEISLTWVELPVRSKHCCAMTGEDVECCC